MGKPKRSWRQRYTSTDLLQFGVIGWGLGNAWANPESSGISHSWAIAIAAFFIGCLIITEILRYVGTRMGKKLARLDAEIAREQYERSSLAYALAMIRMYRRRPQRQKEYLN